MQKPEQTGIKQESDMYAPVKAYLQAQGWEVKAEIKDCDAAAVLDGKLLAVEMKLTLNLDVILQGIERQSRADMVYLAVPKKGKAMASPRWKETMTLLQRLNIGLLVVSLGREGPDVDELLTPQCKEGAAKGHAARIRKTTLREFNGRSGDYNTGGVRGQKLLTVYRQAALRLAGLLAEKGPMSAKQMKPEGEKSRSTYMIMKDNYYGWFQPVGGGLFELTDAGKAGLHDFGGAVTGKEFSEEDYFAGTVED